MSYGEGSQSSPPAGISEYSPVTGTYYFSMNGTSYPATPHDGYAWATHDWANETLDVTTKTTVHLCGLCDMLVEKEGFCSDCKEVFAEFKTFLVKRRFEELFNELG